MVVQSASRMRVAAFRGRAFSLPKACSTAFPCCLSILGSWCGAGLALRTGVGRVRFLSSSPARCVGLRGRPTARVGGPRAASGRRCGGGCRGVRLPHGASARRPAGAARPRSRSAACRSCRGGSSGDGSSRPRTPPVWVDASSGDVVCSLVRLLHAAGLCLPEQVRHGDDSCRTGQCVHDRSDRPHERPSKGLTFSPENLSGA